MYHVAFVLYITYKWYIVANKLYKSKTLFTNIVYTWYIISVYMTYIHVWNTYSICEHMKSMICSMNTLDLLYFSFTHTFNSKYLTKHNFEISCVDTWASTHMSASINGLWKRHWSPKSCGYWLWYASWCGCKKLVQVLCNSCLHVFSPCPETSHHS